MPESDKDLEKEEWKPTDRGDRLAYEHDKAYGKILKSGKVKAKDLYTGYSSADANTLKKAWRNVKKHGDAGSLAVAGGLSAKRLLAKAGLTKRIHENR